MDIKYRQKCLSQSSGTGRQKMCRAHTDGLSVSMVILLVVTSGPCVQAARGYFPPFFNAALHKTAVSDPDGVTCGEGARSTYCDSYSNVQSTKACRDESCSSVCPNGETFPIYESTSGRLIDTTFNWGACVHKEGNFPAPTTDAGQCMRFTGVGQDCLVPLVPAWLVNIVILRTIWQTSFTVWIYNKQGNNEGTILDAYQDSTTTESVLRISLNRDQLKITSGSGTLTHPNWIIQRDVWSHLGIQLYNNSVSVFINGQHIYPSYHNLTLRSNRNARIWALGKSRLEYDPFVGYLQDFRVYDKVLVNRGMASVANNGTFDSTRIYSPCLCPDNFPLIKDTDSTFCVQNPGVSRSSTESYRLDRNAHPIEFINDDKENSAWITATPLEDIAVQLDLDDTFEIRHVNVVLYSSIPSLLTIERKSDPNATWTAWQYYSENCQSWVGREENAPLIGESDVNCKKIVNFDQQYIYSGGRIKFDLLEGRPGITNGVMTPELRNFLMARAVRVTLKGHPFVTNNQQKYHALSEIKVNATCDCNGHGTDCYRDQYPYVCQCAPASYTAGRKCDTCVGETYHQSGDVKVSDPAYCSPCDCHVDGTINGNTTCEQIGGQCDCKPLVRGRACDACADGYFNITGDDSHGCQPCDCYLNGTIGGSSACDLVTGQCLCKKNVMGLKCDTCKPGYSLLVPGHPDGCLGCFCHENGTIPGDDTCDFATASCKCKTYVTGRSCDRCVDGTFDLRAEHPAGCEPCLCDVRFGAVNVTCDPQNGQCLCRSNVEGKRCDACSDGFYAMDMNSVRLTGCSLACDCDVTGTDPNHLATCQQLGGQCTCKANVTGRRCDQCSLGFYNFGKSQDAVCSPCQCDLRGTASRNISCDAVTGQCVCAPNVKGVKCNECVDGFYGLSMAGGQSCNPCNCSERGTVPGTNCSQTTGQCECRPTEGDPVHGGRMCSPYVNSILPSYGPLSGGTVISMEGGYFGDTSTLSVFLGTQLCLVDTFYSNQTSLNCTSRNLTSGSPNTELVTKLMWDNGDVTLASQKFVYMDDPVIETIAPLKTILKGGINLTVTGKYINSVMFPKLMVTMVHWASNTKDTFMTMCDVNSGTQMTCPTPALKLPLSFTGRRKRSLTGTDVIPMRSRRQVTNAGANGAEGGINDNQITFYLGFHLDGVETYRNMSLVNPKYGILTVYYDPDFEMFDGEDNIRSYRKYWPIQESHILIKGKNLKLGLSSNDFIIHIGDEFCTNVDLYESFISCVPPATEPQKSDTRVKHPRVRVRVGNIDFLVGYLRYETSIWNYLPFRYGIIGGAGALLLVIIIIIVICVTCHRKEKKGPGSVSSKSKKSDKSDGGTNSKGTAMSFISAYESKDGTIQPYMITNGSDLLSILPEELRVTIVDLIVDKENVEVGKIIGEGHFGDVHIGHYTKASGIQPELVAIKTLKEGPNRTKQDTVQFLEEATMMKEFQHTNVLTVEAVVLDEVNVQVILPYMENGDLKTYISKEDNFLTVGELIHFGLQITAGMAYLTENHFVHRDLACRNCMINKHLIVKVADFGLSRDIYEQDYYRVGNKKRPLPIKWMSMESLDQGIFTTKSDVWSYGVVLWELLTRGCPPYPDVDAYDIKTYLFKGKRMDRPDYAPDEIYSLMLKCWSEEPDRRPTFRQIRDRMLYFLDEVNTQTFKRDKQGQHVPSIAFRGRSYREHIPR